MTNTALETSHARFDVAVVGGGPVGLSAAIAFARRGARTALVVRASGQVGPDLRTAALFPQSVAFLTDLGVWRGIEAETAPLEAIRILDGTSWLLRAPETLFSAAELGEAALASNVGNATLLRALAATAEACPLLAQVTCTRTPAYAQGADGIEIGLAGSRPLLARLVVAADGRASPLREFAGIAAHTRKLDQTALVMSFSHSRPHANVSTEIHRDAGPLTTVPLPGNRSSLVWVERPRVAEQLAELPDGEFLRRLQAELHGLLGELSQPGPRMTFPLIWLDADCFARDRVALVGEAAHVLPPIGAQGLNLGLRDVADLVSVAAPVLAAGGDPGGPQVLAAFDAKRRSDTRARGITVDLLNRSLESGTLGLQLARGVGLFAMSLSPPLKRLVMRHGAGGLGLPPVVARLAEIIPPPAGGASG